MTAFDGRSHDQRRLGQINRLALAGLLIGLGATLIAALLGLSGQAGAAILLVITAFGCVAAALVGFGFAIIDELRRLPVAMKRVGISVLYFVLGALAIVASVGAASGIALSA